MININQFPQPAIIVNWNVLHLNRIKYVMNEDIKQAIRQNYTYYQNIIKRTEQRLPDREALASPWRREPPPPLTPF